MFPESRNGVLEKQDVQAVQECLTLAGGGISMNVLEVSQKGTTQEDKESSEQVYLRAGRFSQAPSVGTL